MFSDPFKRNCSTIVCRFRQPWGSCTYNVGIYTTDGTVKDEDVFATTVLDGVGFQDMRHEAANINTCGQKMYELAGDSSDPGGYYYIAATFSATGGSGYMSFHHIRCELIRSGGSPLL